MDYTLIIVIIALLIFVIGRRIIGSRKGTKYSTQSIFLRPLIYIVLSAILILGLQPLQTAIIIIAVVLGVFIGMELGKKSDIFEKDGTVLYKRSNEVLAIWLIAFVIRIAINFVANPVLLSIATNSSAYNSTSLLDTAMATGQSNPLIFIADIILALSAGLLFGEALVLYKNFNSKYKNGR